MSKFRIRVRHESGVVFDKGFEADDWSEATFKALEDFKTKPVAADSTTWDVHIGLDDDDA